MAIMEILLSFSRSRKVQQIIVVVQGPPNNFLFGKCFKKKKTTEYFLKSTILSVNNGN